MLRITQVALAALFLLMLAACHPKPKSPDNTMTADSSASPILRMEGHFFQRPFMNKIGRTDDAQQEAHFLFVGEEYFVKFCEGKVSRDEVQKLLGMPVVVQGELHIGMLDICPGDPDYAQSRGGKYVAIQSLQVSSQPLLSYSDGSGNLYEANATTLRYVPVKPEQSSSGTYDGGKYTVKAITPEQYSSLKTAFEKAHSATSEQTDARGMGTGQVGWQQAKTEWTVILKMGSKAQSELEGVLKGELER
jgi:hypothetical protein